jgi:hypothetical protein
VENILVKRSPTEASNTTQVKALAEHVMLRTLGRRRT